MYAKNLGKSTNTVHTAVKVPGRNTSVIAVMIRISVLSLLVHIAIFLDSSPILLDCSAIMRFWRLSFCAMRQYVYLNSDISLAVLSVTKHK